MQVANSVLLPHDLYYGIVFRAFCLCVVMYIAAVDHFSDVHVHVNVLTALRFNWNNTAHVQ